jgi:hypothetical protein
VRGKAAGPAEEAERGHLAQDVVSGHSGGLLDFLTANNGGARRHISDLLLGACDDVDTFFRQSRHFELNLYRCFVLIAKIRRDCLAPEAVRVNADFIDRSAEAVDERPIGRTHGSLSCRPLVFRHCDAGAIDRQPLAIDDRNIHLSHDLQ